MYPASYQKKMQAAHHWDVLAQLEAKNIVQRLKNKNMALYVQQSANNTSYVSDNLTDSTFSQVYHELLTSRLSNLNALDIMEQPDAATVVIKSNVKVLTHKDRGYQRPKPGKYALLTATVAMLYDVQYWGDMELVAFPLVGLKEYFNWRKDTAEEPVEVIITTKAVEGKKILMSDSHIYYINPDDKDHYIKTGRHFTIKPE